MTDQPERPAAVLAAAENDADIALLHGDALAAFAVCSDHVPALTTLGTQMLGLLERLAESDPVAWCADGIGRECGVCRMWSGDTGAADHEPDCAWVGARALLAGTGPEVAE